MVRMKPMLATPVESLPDGAGWAFEFKWDGVRALLDVSEQGVRIASRNGNDITAAYPELVAAYADAGDALVDGEVVAFVGGRPSFEALQSRMHVRGAGQARRLAMTTPVNGPTCPYSAFCSPKVMIVLTMPTSPNLPISWIRT